MKIVKRKPVISIHLTWRAVLVTPSSRSAASSRSIRILVILEEEVDEGIVGLPGHHKNRDPKQQ